MKDLFFVLKMFGLTIVVALIMQARVGEKTIEDEFHQFLKTSVFVVPIQDAVDGAIAATKDGYKKADVGVKKLLSKVSRRREDSRERTLSSVMKLKRYNEDQDENEYLEEATKVLPAKKPEIAAPTKTGSTSPRGISL
jgi:hypothetical protein